MNLRIRTIIILPIRTVSETNQSEHWATRQRRAKAQRLAAFAALHRKVSIPKFPIVIGMTRIAQRQLDQGNLEASFKHIQDGIADWLCGIYGHGQDRMEGLIWSYGQRKGRSKEYAVEIEILEDK